LKIKMRAMLFIKVF